MEGVNYLIPCRSSSTPASKPRLYSRDLPAGIVFDILFKLPVKSLLRYRCVSKIWCNLIDSPSFANKHMSTHVASAAEEPEFMYLCYPSWNAGMGLYFVRYDGNVLRANKYPIFSSRPYSYVTHYLSYGLFCFHNQDLGGNAVLFNPLRGEVMILPQPTLLPPHRLEKGVEHYGLGFDATTNTYKIVRLFYDDTDDVTYKNLRYQKLATEVYTLGTRSWRRISSGGPPCDVGLVGVSAYGDIHWQNRWTYPEEGMIDTPSFIISFDSRKEEFNWTPLPEVMGEEDDEIESIHLLNLRGSLAIVCVLSPTDLEIWVMKDYDTKEWAREYTVSIELWATEGKNMRGDSYPVPDPIQFVGAWEHGLYFDDLYNHNIYLYDLTTGCMQCVPYKPSEDATLTFDHVISYTGTLVSLKNYGHTRSDATELGPGFSYALNRANLVYIFP